MHSLDPVLSERAGTALGVATVAVGLVLLVLRALRLREGRGCGTNDHGTRRLRTAAAGSTPTRSATPSGPTSHPRGPRPRRTPLLLGSVLPTLLSLVGGSTAEATGPDEAAPSAAPETGDGSASPTAHQNGVAVLRLDPSADRPRTSLPLAGTTDPAGSAPAGADGPGPIDTQEPAVEPELATGPTSAVQPSLAIEHVVRPGDHLWGIAEEQVALRLGRAPTDREVHGYWRALIDANRDRLVVPGDPDLIMPGQVLTLPS